MIQYACIVYRISKVQFHTWNMSVAIGSCVCLVTTHSLQHEKHLEIQNCNQYHPIQSMACDWRTVCLIRSIELQQHGGSETEKWQEKQIENEENRWRHRVIKYALKTMALRRPTTTSTLERPTERTRNAVQFSCMEHWAWALVCSIMSITNKSLSVCWLHDTIYSETEQLK